MKRPAGYWRHRLFQAAVILKGIDAVLEVIGGALLVAFGQQGIGRTVRFLTQHELTEDPHDLVAGWVLRYTRHIGVATVHFAAAYLLVHGLVKVGLAGGLIREKRWVFPVALVFLGMFVLYQLYRFQHHPSAPLAFLTVLDLAIMALVWREYVALPHA